MLYVAVIGEQHICLNVCRHLKVPGRNHSCPKACKHVAGICDHCNNFCKYWRSAGQLVSAVELLPLWHVDTLVKGLCKVERVHTCAAMAASEQMTLSSHSNQHLQIQTRVQCVTRWLAQDCAHHNRLTIQQLF